MNRNTIPHFMLRCKTIDLIRYGMSRGEFAGVKRAVGLEALIDPDAPDVEMLTYLAHEADKEEKLLEEPWLLKTPIVRNGKHATVGFCPDIWATWE